MPPKAAKPKAAAGFKAGVAVKDVLPASVKNPPREGKSLKVIDPAIFTQSAAAVATLNAPVFEEFQKVEEWPGDESAKSFDFGLESNTLFIDQSCTPFKLTPSFSNDSTNLIFWRRPGEFIKTEFEEVSSFVNKYNLRRRTSQMMGSSENAFTNSPQRAQQELPITAIKVFDHYEREETPQEAETRKKEAAILAEKDKKAKKPAGKKEEVVEDKPGFVKDIRLSNVDLSYGYPVDSKWIASQLQLIKDRSIKDCFTGKPLWTKIYPQQEGIPVANKSGRYWVKLYYLGKERKVEIDDRMPVNFKGLCKFARSTKKEEIWTCLISKAIFKLIQLSQDISHIGNLCGSGFVMYSLTGMMSQTIPMQVSASTEWNQKLSFIKEMLSDQHFVDSDILLTCYSDPTAANSSASTRMNTQQKHQFRTAVKDSQNFQENVEEVSNDGSRIAEESPQLIDPRTPNNNRQLDTSQDDLQYADGQSNPRSPFKRKTTRNLTTGGLVRGTSQIMDTLNSRVQYGDGEEPDAQNSAIASGGQNSPSRIAQSLKRADSVIAQAKKANAGGQLNSYVIGGFSYPVVECFFNETFNMVYVQKRSDKEIRLRTEYVEHSNQPINKMTKEEKIEQRRKKKELRDKIGEEEKKRIELITRPPIQYKFFRLKTTAGRVPPVSVVSPFTNDEIEIAKTCIVNRLNKPPNYQESVEVRDDGKSVISSVIKNGEESMQMRPLDDFSALGGNFSEPMPRGSGGVWMQEADICTQFQHFQVFYNPAKYPNHHTVNVSQAAESEITVGEDHEVLLIERNSERENQAEKVMLLFGFTAKEAKNTRITPEPYCILQKFDFGSFNAIHEYEPLRGNHNSQLTEIENSNQVFKMLVYTPVSFSVSISCTNTFRTMSVLSYLTEYEGYNVKSFLVEHPALEEKRYQVLFRMKINAADVETLFLMKVRSTTDANMLKYLRLKLIEQDKEGEGQMLHSIEGVHKNLFENVFTLSTYLRLALREKTTYYLMLEGEPPYSVAEGALNVEFFSKNSDLPVENLEHVEPLQYVEKYLPTKYGIIFREKLYVGENTLTSLHLRIADMIGGGSNAGAAAVIDPKKKPAAKGAPEASDLVEKEIEDRRLLKLELFENGKSIVYNTGYNSTLLSNLVLKSTKSEEVTYILEATFDLRDWPAAKTLSSLTENLYWNLKVISTETVAIVRDTEKEDREKAIRKSWEDQELGRAEKAKKARRKHQLIEKSQNGEKLTEEEAAIIAEPRLTKKQREEAAAANQLGAGGKKAPPPKKDEKKAPAAAAAKGAKGKGEEVVEEKKEIRPVPVSSNHSTNEIRAFLEHMEQERVSEHLAEHPGLIDVRSEENKQQLKDDAEKAKEEVVYMLSKNSQLREELKAYQSDQLKAMQTSLHNDRSSFKESWGKFLESREEAKSKMGAKLQKEKELSEIMKQEKPVISVVDLERIISEYSNIAEFNVKLVETARKVVKNLKVYAMIDKINDCLTNFNIDGLNSTMEEYVNLSVTGIEEELLQKARDLIAEVKENPNFLADKQAELKKGGKKPGKK